MAHLEENGETRKTILYIEDDEASRVLVRKILEERGYRVLTAHDGLLGIDAARRYRPDLILMDINLPHLSGEAVTTRLRSMPGTDHIPIVAITAQGSPGDRERALVAGCVGFIAKPVDVDKLPGLVDEYLNGRRDELSGIQTRRYQAEYSQSLVARLEAKVRQLEAANRELQRIDKMKGDFITLTSHEMRTPLTLVQGYAHLLEDAAKDLCQQNPSSEIPSLVDNMARAVERLSEIVNEILDVSRIATGQWEPAFGPIYLKQVVDEAVAGVEKLCWERNVTILVPEEGWPGLIQADGELLLVTLSNVLGNAIKYTPDGGRIRVGVRVIQETVDMTIEDTGIGIDPEDQLFIFEQFYTASDVQLHTTSKTSFKGGGLGLGLAVAKGAIEAHGGKIWVESSGRDEEAYPGSVFHLLLPLKRITEQGEASSAASWRREAL